MDIRLIDMMPSSINNDDTVKAICETLQPFVNEMWEVVSLISIYKNVDSYDHEILDELAYHFHVDFYRDDLDLEVKRRLIKNSVRYHRLKGTPAAVEEMLSDLFSESWLEEWFEHGGDPYYFRVYTSDMNLDQTRMDMFFEALYTIKNTRSWLEGFYLVIREVILYRDSTKSYKTKYWMTNEVPSGRIPTQSYKGITVNDKLVIGSGGRISDNRPYRSQNIRSGESANKRGGNT